MSILALSVQASPLIAAILLARAVLLHRLPRRTFSLLWALAALRLLIPLSLPSRLSIFAWGRAGMEAAAGAFGPSDALSLVPLMQDPAAGPAAPSPFFAIWVLGAALCALFFLAGHARFLWRCRTALPVEGERFAWLRGRTVRKIRCV